MLQIILRRIIVLVSHLIAKLLVRLTITGQEHLPSEGPLIVIANHFSWFEAPLLGLHLPYELAYFAAAEMKDWSPILRIFIYLFDIIPVHRGQIDRTALRRALKHLENKGVLVIFPEGGIDPDLQQEVATGRPIPMDEGQNSRLSAELITARPGTSFLAVQSHAPILPVAFLGTEMIQGNLRRWRRTPVEMHIGPVFGPFDLEPGLRRAERRDRLDDLGDRMMRQIADLLPPKNRGPYV